MPRPGQTDSSIHDTCIGYRVYHKYVFATILFEKAITSLKRKRWIFNARMCPNFTWSTWYVGRPRCRRFPLEKVVHVWGHLTHQLPFIASPSLQGHRGWQGGWKQNTMGPASCCFFLVKCLFRECSALIFTKDSCRNFDGKVIDSFWKHTSGVVQKFDQQTWYTVDKTSSYTYDPCPQTTIY